MTQNKVPENDKQPDDVQQSTSKGKQGMGCTPYVILIVVGVYLVGEYIVKSIWGAIVLRGVQ